jgi:hypothetical protein
VWFAVLGGSIAWAVQFIVNLMLGFAQCNAPPGRWSLPLHDLEIAISAAAIAVGVLAEVVAGWLYLRTARLDHVAEEEREGEGTGPPIGRINFLAMVGLTVNFLSLAIVVMTGIGAPLLPTCQQS